MTVVLDVGIILGGFIIGHAAYSWHARKVADAYHRGGLDGVSLANESTGRLLRGMREHLADRHPDSFDDFIEALVAVTAEITKEADNHPPPH